MFKIISLFLLIMMSLSSVEAKSVHINSLRYWTAPDHTRMVFDISKPADHQVFLLKNPNRLVIDFSDAQLLKPLIQPPKNNNLFSRIRSGVKAKKGLRVVVDLKTVVMPKSFSLKPNKKYGYRLVVDLFPKNNKAQKVIKKSVKKQAKRSKGRDIIIAIDAGHGGDDPGAKGASGVTEKKVVLQIAKKLSRLINRTKGLKAVMIRKGDYYIGLKKRRDLARKARADLFISIHADAFKSPKAKGASVYTLSNRGATSLAAKWLEDSENSADLMGGVKLAGQDDMLATVLMDLSQTATKEVSRDVAGSILKNFKKIGHLHKKTVQKARFMVLKSPDIPSILVETAYISNPSEERKLKSSKYQMKMANAIFKGVVSYFNKHAPINTYLSRRATTRSRTRHVISRGETLSGIALYYGVSMRSIKSVNALASSHRIRIGQVLKIPKG